MHITDKRYSYILTTDTPNGYNGYYYHRSEGYFQAGCVTMTKATGPFYWWKLLKPNAY